jgi:hypothetical protein
MKTDIKTTLNNKEYVVRGLIKLGYKIQVAKEGEKLETRGYFKNTKSSVDILITHMPNGDSTQNEVGLTQTDDGTFIATGDYYFTRGLTSQGLTNVLTVEAKKEEVNDRLMALGFEMNPNVLDGKDEVELTFNRWS